MTLSLILMILNLTKVTSGESRIERSSNYYNVVTLGAKPDSMTDSSRALKVAWNSACGSTGRSTIFIPQGRFLIRSALKFSGKGCKSGGITFMIKGTLVAPTDFRVLGKSKTWVAFEDVYGVTISGGVFDGEGAGLWACKRSGNGGCPQGITVRKFHSTCQLPCLAWFILYSIMLLYVYIYVYRCPCLSTTNRR